MTKSLVEGGITPGYRSQGTEEKPEKPIKGCNYITYRYFNEMRKESKWPNSDPCSSIDVNVPGQANIPELIRKKAEEKQDAVKQEFK